MPLSQETVKYVAQLSRIELNQQELEKLSKQLQAILDFIDKLSEIDTKNIEPTSHILPVNNVLRTDTPAPSLILDKTLKNSPSKEGNFFKVPKVIE